MKPDITFDDFMKLDIRVGEVKSAENVPDSNKLIELSVDFGEEIGKRTILTGLQKWFTLDDFVGKKFMFIANMPPRKMAGRVSQGMIMAADEGETPVLIPAPESIANGTMVR